MRIERQARCMALALAAFALAGCTTFSAEGSFGDVEKIAKERLGKDVTWQRTDEGAARARDDVQRLLAKELSPDDAVQIALFNNPGLQASYAGLGIAEADLVQLVPIGHRIGTGEWMCDE